MISPDLVRYRRSGNRLILVPMQPAERAQALDFADQLLDLTQKSVGTKREVWEELIAPLMMLPPKQKKMALALYHLLEKQCSFTEEDLSISKERLRKELFERATTYRRTNHFDRQHILHEVANVFSIPQDQMEAHLYSDLKGEQILTTAPLCTKEDLVLMYEQSQLQAVLLRATQMTIKVSCGSSNAYRKLFQKIKFLKLLFSIQSNAQGTYDIQINGPFSLFESTTKYGLQLAMLVPELRRCDSFHLQAQIRWGKTKTPLSFEWEETLSPKKRTHFVDKPPEEILSLKQRFSEQSSLFSIDFCDDFLHLPEFGICIPDLQFTHQKTGEIIYLELLGFWSRDAVWKRVEWLEKGFPHKIIFAISKRLRVSEKAIGEDLPGALYVFHESLSPKAIEERLHTLMSRKNRNNVL